MKPQVEECEHVLKRGEMYSLSSEPGEAEHGESARP